MYFMSFLHGSQKFTFNKKNSEWLDDVPLSNHDNKEGKNGRLAQMK